MEAAVTPPPGMTVESFVNTPAAKTEFGLSIASGLGITPVPKVVVESITVKAVAKNAARRLAASGQTHAFDISFYVEVSEGKSAGAMASQVSSVLEQPTFVSAFTSQVTQKVQSKLGGSIAIDAASVQKTAHVQTGKRVTDAPDPDPPLPMAEQPREKTDMTYLIIAFVAGIVVLVGGTLFCSRKLVRDRNRSKKKKARPEAKRADNEQTGITPVRPFAVSSPHAASGDLALEPSWAERRSQGVADSAATDSGTEQVPRLHIADADGRGVVARGAAGGGSKAAARPPGSLGSPEPTPRGREPELFRR